MERKAEDKNAIFDCIKRYKIKKRCYSTSSKYCATLTGNAVKNLKDRKEFRTYNIMLIGNSTIKRISAVISDEELEMARVYVQGAIHAHCNCCKDETFSVRELFGGDNKNWKGTPLQRIYEYFRDERKSRKPEKMAAIDVGWILKRVLVEDTTREFETVGEDSGKRYLFKRYISEGEHID